MKIKSSLKEYKRASKNFYKIIVLLSPKIRIYVCILLISLIFTSISELLGLSALIPLINSINNKQFITDGLLGNYLSYLSLKTGLTSEIVLTISTVILIFIAYLARILANYYILNISNLIGLTVHNKALKSYLKLSYSDQTSSLNDNLAFCLSNQINQIVNGYIYPLISIISSLFVVFALGSGLFIFSPTITWLLIVFASLFYFILGYFFFGNLKRGGRKNDIDQNNHLLLTQMG